MTYNDLLTEISDIRKISVAMKNSPVINTKLEMFGLYTEDIVRLIKKYKGIDLNSFELDKYYEINYIYIAIGLIQNKNIEKQLTDSFAGRSPSNSLIASSKAAKSNFEKER